jgi:putative acetyltransferase
MLASTGSKKNPAIVLEELARPGLQAGTVAASRGVSILTGVFRGEKIAQPTRHTLAVGFVRLPLEELVGSADEITVELVPEATEDVRALIVELEEILSAEYPPEQRHGLALDAIFTPHIRFFLARSKGVAVGCGGVAFFADFAEVKRMYVRDVARGRGVAQALLARIEREARDAGFVVLKLETGVRQIAALRFYQRAGFQPCSAFGAYATMAPQTIATSVFLQKQL